MENECESTIVSNKPCHELDISCCDFGGLWEQSCLAHRSARHPDGPPDRHRAYQELLRSSLFLGIDPYEHPLNATHLITSARQAPKWAAVLTTRIENGIATASCWNSLNKSTYSTDPPQY